MHKQLVTPSSRDKLLQTSLRKKNHFLGLGNRNGQGPRHVVRRTLQDYFPKRLAKSRLETNSKFRKLTEKVVADFDGNDPIRIVSGERETCGQASETSSISVKVEVSPPQVGEVVKSEVCDEEDGLLVKQESVDQEDLIGNFKQDFREYCSVRWRFQIVLSMLQERLEELENGNESSIGNDSAGGDDLVEESQEGMSSVNQASNRTVESATVDRTPSPSSVPTEEGEVSAGLLDEGSSEPDKENYAPPSQDEEHATNSSTLVKVTSASNPEENLLVKQPGYSLLESSKSEILEPTYTCDIELEPLEGRKASFVDSLLNKFNLEPPVMPPVNSSSGPDGGDAADGHSPQQQRRCLRDRTKIAARPRYIEIPEEPRRVRVSKVFGKLHKTINLDELDSTNSNSSTEFYGFDEGEVVKLDKPSLPGLLPTPIVKKSQPYAPFLAYGTSIADALSGCDDGASTSFSSSKSTVSDGTGNNELFREEGLIEFGSLPPRLECPRRPNDMVRPRTVAQKRILLQKENDVRYLIIDNESKIFHFLEKRSKNIDAELDICRMKQLQDQQIPFTRDTWRALAWLRTLKGLYYFQTHTIDGRTVKLTGCAGNHSSKRLTRKNVFSSAVNASGGRKIHYITHCRCPEYPDGVDLDLSAIEPPASEEEQWVAKPRPKLLPSDAWVRSADYRQQPSFSGTKPGPLSSKRISHAAYEDDPYLGPLEIFHMPTAELEVFPKINRPLDGYVKPFLKMILPHSGITENWARFAVSTLRSTRTGDGPDDDERSFVFELPYANDARKLLVRRRLIARPGEELTVACRAKTEVKGVTDLEHFERVLAERLSFREAIDQALERGETVDADERICADIVTELTNSVAITVAEDMFMALDPDAVSRTPQQEQPAKTAKPLSVDTDCATATSHPALPLSSSASPSATAAAPSEGTEGKSCEGKSSEGKSSEGTASKAANDTAKLKLLREMKRLNATIIESPSHAPPPTGNAATGESQQQPCDPVYCALGCICDILGRSEQISSTSSAIASSLRRLHCKEAHCVLGCVCGYEQKSVNHTQQVQTQGDMKGSVEGSSALTSADVKYLREKATARLAKVERDFAPTVILTDNATVLVRNTESETRRQKKKPKKYDDYYNENSMQILLKGGTLESQHSTEATAPPPLEPLPLSERMRHAHVLLMKLPELSTLEPWCMVHELYRCYCGGTATHGKSFSFYEENCVSLPASKGVSKSETSTTPTIASRMMSNKVVQDVPLAAPSGSSVYGVPRKRLYSFEKVSPTAGGVECVPNRVNAWMTPARPSASIVTSAPVSGRASFRKRDSSEESYKPVSEWKQPKRKFKAADDAGGAAVSGAIAYRRNSTIAKRRFSMAVTGGNLDRAADPTQAAIAGSSTKVARWSDPQTRFDAGASVSDAQYKIIPRSTPKSTGISNIVLKRIPPVPDAAQVNRNIAKSVKTSLPPPKTKVVLPEMHASVVISDSSDESSPECEPSSRVLVSREKMRGPNTDGAHVSTAVTKVLTVHGLKQLIHREHQHGTPVPAGKNRIQYVHLVDSHENVQNHEKYRILLDKSKRLIVCGDNKSFVHARVSSRKDVLQRLAPYPQVMVYIVQMLPNLNAASTSVRHKGPETMRSSSASTSHTQLNRPKGTDGSGRVQGDCGASMAAGADQKAQISTKQQQQQEQNDQQVASLIRHIRTLLMRATLHINMVKSGILHMCRWPALLNAFTLGQADVLDVTFASGERQTVITTDHSADMLFHQYVQSSFSARRSRFVARSAAEPLPPEQRRRSLLMELILTQADSVRMSKDLGLILYGGEHCWLFCGFFDMKGNGTASKTSDNNRPQAKPPVVCSFAKSSSSKPEVNMITEQSLSKAFLNSGRTNLHIINAATVPKSTASAPASADSEPRIKCRWLKLTIANDFSDMFIPSWKCSVSFSQIRNAIDVANSKRTVFCLKCTNHSSEINMSSPRIYAVPYQSCTVFMGPYPLWQKTIDIKLCQSVDGVMYTREEYERRNGVICDKRYRTAGRWIEMKVNAIENLQRGLDRSKVDRNPLNKVRGSKSSVVKTAPAQPPPAPPAPPPPPPTPTSTSTSTAPAKPIISSVANNRSLLKRSFTNGPSSATCNGGVNENETNSSVSIVANCKDGSSSSNKDSIVILENEDNNVEKAGPTSTNPPTASTAVSSVDDGEEGIQNGKRKRLSSVISAELSDDGADRLLKLLEKTMQQTRQEKQKLELMIKSSQAKGETAQLFAAPLVDPKRKTSGSEEQTVPSALRQQRRLSLRPSVDGRLETTPRPATSDIVPSGLQRNAQCRISLPNPVPMTKTSVKLPVEQANVPKTDGHAKSHIVSPPNGATAKTGDVGSGGLKVRSMESLRIRPAESVVSVSNATGAKDHGEVVCLDDDDDGDDDNGTPIGDVPANGIRNTPGVGGIGKGNRPQMVLSQQQAALIASKLNLKSGGDQQLGFKFNPTNGVVAMKRSLIQSITQSSEQLLGAAGGKHAEGPRGATATPFTAASLAALRRQSIAVCTSTPTTSASTVLLTHPPTFGAPKETTPRSSEADQSFASGLVCLTEDQEARLLSKRHVKGVLKSNIPNLGLVEVVRMRNHADIIIRMRELTAQKQYVSVPTFASATILLNEFIQKNTYTLMPFSLHIKWIFEERSTPLPPQEKLTSIINRRSVVTSQGIVDLSKPDLLQGLQTMMPEAYDDLMLRRLAMLCYPKELYEKHKCYDNEEKIFTRATEVISTLKQSTQAKEQELCFYKKMLKKNEEKFKRLQEPRAPQQQRRESVATYGNRSADGGNGNTTVTTSKQNRNNANPGGGVIVIEDD
ncbi:uncharacterized protein LOC131215406 [Anopheles bellator]|uniref:uncharacterized protein LOC131215406 n=1 Tax=Anopheles bellator TaxID=139047 RepID=UPI0026470677|nr:uncharacterized protein LOC131215406 [Anopheles bellator]